MTHEKEIREMLEKAIRIVMKGRHPSISYIQSRLDCGYRNAYELMAAMERYGIVSPQPKNGSRTILVDNYLEAIDRLR